MPKIRHPNGTRLKQQKKKKSASIQRAVLFYLMFSIIAIALLGPAFLSKTFDSELNHTSNLLKSVNISNYDAPFSSDTTTVNDKKKPNPLQVGYAITITNCTTDNERQLIDAAAVLQHSIHLSSSRNPFSKSRYDYQMYAFIHNDAKNMCDKVASALQQIGYQIQWRPTPFQLQDISNALLQEKIHKQGCCEEKEFLKLYTLQLKHSIAVHLDLDTLVLKPWDHLFNTMLVGIATNKDNNSNNNFAADRALVQRQVQSHNPHTSKNWLPSEIISYFTRDYNMAKPGIKPLRVGMQGGFWIVRPSLEVFDEILTMIIHNGDRYNIECGWGGCDIGSARFYGGAGFQGVISYFYTFYLPEVTGKPSQFVELDRCLFNNMVDTARSGCQQNKGDVAACNHCNDTAFSYLYGVHFTLCGKPWICPRPEIPLCYRLHHAWHTIRVDFEDEWRTTTSSSNVSKTTSGSRYVALDDTVYLDDPKGPKYTKRIFQKFPSHCPKPGKKAYQSISFENLRNRVPLYSTTTSSR